MVRSLREGLEGAQFKTGNSGNAVRRHSPRIRIARLRFPFRNKKDYADYVSRLHQISRCLTSHGHMRDGVRDHLIPPTYLLEKVSSQAQGLPTTRWTRVHSQNRCASFRFHL